MRVEILNLQQALTICLAALQCVIQQQTVQNALPYLTKFHAHIGVGPLQNGHMMELGQAC